LQGLYLWDNGGDSEKAAEHFVLSAKSDPNNAVAFKYLGHYYSRVTLDLNRAAKCYQRAVLINPNDSDSGEALCDLFDRQGKEILEIAVCRDASEKSPKAFWAFCRLGYIQVWFQLASSVAAICLYCLALVINGYGFYHSFIRRSGLKLFRAYSMQLEVILPCLTCGK